MASTHFVLIDTPAAARAARLADVVAEGDAAVRRAGGLSAEGAPGVALAGRKGELVRGFEGGNASGFLLAVLQYGAALLTGSDEEVLGKFLLAATLFPEVAGEREYRQVVDAAVEAATGRGPASPRLRLRVLAEVYNAADTRGAAKVSALRGVVEFAGASDQVAELDGFLKVPGTLPALLRRWEAPMRDVRRLLAAAASAVSRGHGTDAPSRAQAYRLHYLATWESAAPPSGEEEAECRTVAVAAALGYIRAPVVSHRSELPALQAIRRLADSPDTNKVHRLLSIFATGRLPEFRAFEAEHGAWMDEQGVDRAQSLRTMRLLSLTSAAAAAADAEGEAGGVLSYASIAEAIDVSEDEVEAWVVDSIRLGLLDARMDQARRQVRVAAAVHREFGADEWEVLRKKMGAWKDHVASFSDTLRAAHAAGGGGRL